MSLIENLVAKQGAEVADGLGVSNRAIAVAAGHLYQAANALRQAPQVTARDVSEYLTPAMQHVAAQLQNAAARSRIAALERPKAEPTPNLARSYEDPVADFLTDMSNGQGVQIR